MMKVLSVILITTTRGGELEHLTHSIGPSGTALPAGPPHFAG
jgi:hypothetical protein